jgi:hypothetical protein
MISGNRQHCPNCGYEYESWVETCPDCNTALVAPAPQEPPRLHLDRDKDPRWTVVGNVPNAILGTLMKSQIESVGIPVLMFRSPSADIAEFSHNDYVPHDLLVPKDRLEEARAIMDGRHAPGPFPDEWEDEAEPPEGPGASEDRYDNGTSIANRRLPEGWSVLPGEYDLEDTAEAAQRREQTPPGWYWSDDAGGDVHAEASASQPGRVRRIPTDYAREESHYGSSSSGRSGDWYRPSRATKIIYAVLLLIMGLPFILQILESIASFFNP